MFKRRLHVWKLIAALGASAFAFACLDRELVDLPPSVQSGVRIHINNKVQDKVDLLVVVDNSNSMREEQTNLAANMPILIDQLTTPPLNEDGEPDYPAVRSLHIGVVSTDMGAGGYPICHTERGDNGVLQHLPSPDVDGCEEVYEPYLTYDADTPDLNIAKAFECISTLGTSGCGFEQQLFAMEQALTVHSAPGAANSGFLRDDALLAVLIVTDEEDCSVEDEAIFDETDASLGPNNLRCFLNTHMVRPVDEFVEALLGVKPQHPDQIIVAAIVGVPPDLVELHKESGDIQTREDFDDILEDPRMIERIDNSPRGGGNTLVPSCDTPLGVAYPPRRIVEFIRDVDAVGNNGIVQSICQADWRPTMTAITRLIQSKTDRACLARALVGPGGIPLVSGEHAECSVREELPNDGPCGPGRFEVDRVNGHTVCQVCQSGDGTPPHLVDSLGNDLSACAGSADHWLYTTGTEERCTGSGMVVFTEGARPEDDSQITLECLASVAATSS